MSEQAELAEAPAECSCITEMDALLKDDNTRLSLTFALARGRMAMRVFPTIAVEKLKHPGKRPAIVIPTFCPFCGIPYRPEASSAEPQG